jgi:enoyl-[acyl-carrier protein] reductase I
MDSTFAAIKQEWGGLDFVVHAIAFSDKEELKGQYVATSRRNFLQTLDVSCYSFTAVCQRARALMKDGGSLLTLTYFGAERVMPHYNVMGVAKAALECSVRYLAVDMGAEKIRVNAISAGPIRPWPRPASAASARSCRTTRRSPRCAATSPSMTGGAGIYLLSDLSRGVTGEIHYVDGGYNIVGMMRPESAAELAEMLKSFAERDG